MEAGGLLQHAGYESLLCAGLAAPWGTVRYAAAMALADFGGKVALCKPTLDALRVLQREEEPIPVRLVASYALLRHHDNSGIEGLTRLLHPQAPAEARKAAAFVLAAEPPTDLPLLQRDQLTRLLILALEDPNGEAALHAAQALRNIATPAAI